MIPSPPVQWSQSFQWHNVSVPVLFLVFLISDIQSIVVCQKLCLIFITIDSVVGKCGYNIYEGDVISKNTTFKSGVQTQYKHNWNTNTIPGVQTHWGFKYTILGLRVVLPTILHKPSINPELPSREYLP